MIDPCAKSPLWGLYDFVQSAPQGALSVEPSQYPETRRGEVVDVLHGVTIPDPYRRVCLLSWLEDPDAPETAAWVDEQNAVTKQLLDQCPARGQLRALITRLFDYERFGLPALRGARYYFSHNSGLQQQSVLYSQAGLEGERVLFMDPNVLPPGDGTVALGGAAFSECSSLWAYTLSSGGTDWRTLHFKRILSQDTGETEDLSDELHNVKFTSLAWTHDSKARGVGIFYNAYEPQQEIAGERGTEVHQNLNQAEDALVLEIPEEPTHMMGAEISHDGRYLIISVSEGCKPANKLWYVDLEQIPRDDGGALDFSAFDARAPGARPLPLVKLIDDFAAQWEYVGSRDGTQWTLLTNSEAPRYRIVRAEWASELGTSSGSALATCYLRDVTSVLQLRAFGDGRLLRELPLPGLGSVMGFSGSWKRSEAFYSFAGFTEPGAVYRFDADSPEQEPALFRRTATTGFSPDDFVTEQHFVTSKDGTKVPMFVVHRKGLALDGSNPTLLYGYGGFNISLEPSYSPSRMAWMLAFDGVYAVANLRGGGEYGIEWRDAGSLGNKQNVFDDMAACAEYLHFGGYSSPGRLAIQGGSNGGLLVAATANQRPDLFACVLCQVGVLDMLRCSDYGDPDKPDEFAWVLPYSPIHNVVAPLEGQMPAVLVVTADHDDRVVPLHSHKYTAALQHMARAPGSAQCNPLVARIEVRAGHGAGKPIQKVIDEAADLYAFAAATMGAAWKYDGAKL
eukprot:scaffold3.g6225.t1